MRKALPIILIGIVILGAGAYFLSQNKGQQPAVQIQQQEQSEGQEGSGEQEEITGNLKKILELGRSVKCTWSSEGGVSGTTWAKGGMFYNQVTSETGQAEMIFKNDCMWGWQQGESRGVKMCFSPEEAEEIISGEREVSQQGDASTNVPAEVKYNCQPVVVPDAKFNPPENIQFVDVGQFMQGMGE